MIEDEETASLYDQHHQMHCLTGQLDLCLHKVEFVRKKLEYKENKGINCINIYVLLVSSDCQNCPIRTKF